MTTSEGRCFLPMALRTATDSVYASRTPPAVNRDSPRIERFSTGTALALPTPRKEQKPCRKRSVRSKKPFARSWAAIQKSFGQAIMRLGEGKFEPIAVIPSGSLAIDEALGVGGYPRGRIVEVYRPESSGKTTLTLHAIAEVQKAGGVAAFVDAEHAFDLRYAKNIGIDLTRLLVAQPDCGEQALDISEMLTRSGAVDLVVVDSVAALVPRAETEGDMGDALTWVFKPA